MQTPDQDDNDPRGWSIDQVVAALCHNSTPAWSTVDHPQLIPDRHLLEHTLRQNHVDGDNLLALDPPALKEDLGITSFGQRRALMKAIEYFRLHSPTYQATTFQADAIARMQSTALMSPQMAQLRMAHAPQSPYIGSAVLSSVEPRQPTHSPSLHGGLGWQSAWHADPRVPSFETKPPGFADVPLPSAPVFGSPSTVQLTQQSGVTRTTPTRTETLQTSAINGSLPGRSQTTNLPQPPSGFAAVKGKKKITPTFVSAIQETPAAGPAEDSYLSSSAIPLQDVFYHRINTEFVDDAIYRVLADDKSDNFSISGPGRFSKGQVLGVARHLKFFLGQGVEVLPKTGSRVKFPYNRRRMYKAYSEEYFTLFPRDQGRVGVFRAQDFPEIHSLRTEFTRRSGAQARQYIGPEVRANASSWNYLVDKYPVEDSDEGLPLYGESGDEGVDEETWREIEDEAAERDRLAPGIGMTSDQVEASIKDVIEEMRQEWLKTKRAKIQLRAYRMWMKAAKNKDRRQEIETIKYWKDHFLERTETIKATLAEVPWNNPAELKRQCQTIELTVFQLEEYKYYGQVMLQDTPPERPSRGALKTRVQRQPVLEEGEELIESESEPMTEGEEAGFLEDSWSDVGSIHHEPDAEWNPIVPTVKNVVKSDTVKIQPPEGAGEEGIREATAPDDAHGDDADVDDESSEDDIVTPVRKRKMYERSTSPLKPVTTPGTSTSKYILPLPPNLDRRGSASDTPNSDSSPRAPGSGHRDKKRRISTPVDLTMTSPGEESSNGASTDFSVHTPLLNPVQDKQPRQDSIISLSSGRTDTGLSSRGDSGLPPYTDVPGMRRISWASIEAVADNTGNPDRGRALAKALYGLLRTEIMSLERLVKSLKPDRRGEVLVDGLLVLGEDEGVIRKIKAGQQSSARLLVLLYGTYVCGQDTVTPMRLTDRQRDTAYEDTDEATDSFYDLLCKLIQIYLRHADQPGAQQRTKQTFSDSEDLNDSDIEMLDDTSADLMGSDSAAPPSSERKRKRKVVQSQQALSQQKSDQVRIQEQEQRRQAMAVKLAQVTGGEIVLEPINTTEPYVYLHPHIAQRVKPHQLKGIQFMWREIIEDTKQQGCILAHVMGLGKTMQVISLLVAISLCSHNEDRDVQKQIPAHLRKGKTIVLCPASLVDNWYDELLMWTPDVALLGGIHKADTADTMPILEWSRSSGVLLISYERFRRLVAASEKSKHNGERSVDMAKILLDEPHLVVADEAHKLKNPASSISKYAKKFETKSRIALTGSPLNNHLEEFHAMVDWIAPGYLGNLVQFRSKYSEPINEGLYAESTPVQKRVCLRKLHVLKRALDPKILRADISVIEKDMPTKTEFFLTVALTDLQKRAYDVFVKCMLDDVSQISEGASEGSSEKAVKTNQKGRNARLWSWLSILSLLCHHPSCLLAKMKARASDEQNSANHEGKSPDEGDASTPTAEEIAANPPVDNTGPVNRAMQPVMEILAEIDKPGVVDDPALSYRTLVVQQIVQQAMAAGDKTLIFTHSIPTLNYLERMLTSMDCTYCRLDGNSKVSTRQTSTKEFNQTGRYQVFLISMRAGGLGLNLQGASRVVIFDFAFNPSWEEQAIGRSYRINQKSPVFVYRFQAGGTFEDVSFNTAIFKTQLFGRVVDKKNPIPHASRGVSEYLFPARQVEQLDFQDCLGKDPKILDAIVDRLDCIRSIVMTETFQKEDDVQLNDEDRQEAEQEYRDQRLERDNPAAWQAQQRALQRSAQQDYLRRVQRFVPGPSAQAYIPSSTAPMPFTSATPSSGTRISAPYHLPQVPFARTDLDRPPVGRPLDSINVPATGVRQAYDDTFQDFPRQPNPVRRGSDPDVRMSGN